jgi:hypothetical protein
MLEENSNKTLTAFKDMVTGVECAGLALAILPLVIEAGKAYASGADTLADIAFFHDETKSCCISTTISGGKWLSST